MKLRGLYAITDSQLLAGRFLSHVEAALEGGVCLLQYRDKSDDAARRLREAEALMKLCERYGTQLLINDDAELAARLGVGVHLGQTDGPLTPARALLGRQAIIGSTCHAQLDGRYRGVSQHGDGLGQHPLAVEHAEVGNIDGILHGQGGHRRCGVTALGDQGFDICLQAGTATWVVAG